MSKILLRKLCDLLCPHPEIMSLLQYFNGYLPSHGQSLPHPRPPQPYSCDVEAFNVRQSLQVPRMTVRPVRAAYGGSATLSVDTVVVSDTDTELDDLVFTLEQEPHHGNITNNGQLMTEGDRFRYEQLTNAMIR